MKVPISLKRWIEYMWAIVCSDVRGTRVQRDRRLGLQVPLLDTGSANPHTTQADFALFVTSWLPAASQSNRALVAKIVPPFEPGSLQCSDTRAGTSYSVGDGTVCTTKDATLACLELRGADRGPQCELCGTAKHHVASVLWDRADGVVASELLEYGPVLQAPGSPGAQRSHSEHSTDPLRKGTLQLYKCPLHPNQVCALIVVHLKCALPFAPLRRDLCVYSDCDQPRNGSHRSSVNLFLHDRDP